MLYIAYGFYRTTLC